MSAGDLNRVIAGVITAENASLKRIAWAFGCAKKGSEEEAMLRPILLAKVATEAPAACSNCDRLRGEIAELRREVIDIEKQARQDIREAIHEAHNAAWDGGHSGSSE